jgi:5-hydroxyisourate hydrolase
MRVVLEKKTPQGWVQVGAGTTDADGRVPGLTQVGQDLEGVCRITFHTEGYFQRMNVTEYFYPVISITFRMSDKDEHYHVPLLVNPFGYSTYRGS